MDDAVHRPLELADVRGDPVRQELEHPLRDLGLQLLGLGLQDAQAQLVGRRVDVGDEPPAEARADALLQAGEVGRAAIGRDDDLPAAIDQRVERVKELFLGAVLAADELDVVDHQQVDRAEQLLELVMVSCVRRARTNWYMNFSAER